jgi:diadenosine tetraphosphate (Ap4A) HIT family hydrolase
MNETAPCLTCRLVARRDAGQAPLWDSILRTPSWDLVHSYNSSLPGWLVLVARRHIAAVHEMTGEEAAELGLLLQRASAALREVVGCPKTYVIQFAEAEGHAHVHFHVIPRMADQPEERRSVGIFGYLGVPVAERLDDATMDEIALKVRDFLIRQQQFCS